MNSCRFSPDGGPSARPKRSVRSRAAHSSSSFRRLLFERLVIRELLSLGSPGASASDETAVCAPADEEAELRSPAAIEQTLASSSSGSDGPAEDPLAVLTTADAISLPAPAIVESEGTATFGPTEGEGVEWSQQAQYEANQPIGVAQGLNPGRVAWVHDPNATSWDGSSNYWWDDNNTDQAVVDQMMSKAIRWQAGESSDAAGWDAIFRHFNQSHSGQDVGYASGEKIAIKVNLNNCPYSENDWDNQIDATPQLVLALVRQLVSQAGVGPGSITVFDASRFIPNRLYNPIHAEFPDIQFVQKQDGDGRVGVQPDTDSDDAIHLSGGSGETFRLPTCVTEAKYVINVANLKKHENAGMTITAKNCFGAIMQFRDGGWEWSPSNLHPYVDGNNPMGSYNPIVDLIGHKHTGGKTLLYVVDGLYGAMGVMEWPQKWATFGNDWPSSIFVSQDPVAIDSVALDFLRTETSLKAGTENYLHEAALADNAPSGTTYDPENDGTPLASLGVHEHWNDATNKQYSRNLGTGDGIELISEEPSNPATVVGRYIFYDNSYWDGNAAGPNATGGPGGDGDDGAIATDKSALLPGATATSANFTTYDKGINGIMVDVAGLADPTAVGDGDFSEFAFKVGNDSNPSGAGWTTGAAPTDVDVRDLGGGVYRVSFFWAAGAIPTRNWLQLTLKADDATTGLAQDDIFYFGNCIGDANLDGKTLYDDIFAIYTDVDFVNFKPITEPCDVNRDGKVLYDDIFACYSCVDFTSNLALIAPPVTPSAPAAGSVARPSGEIYWAAQLAALDELDRSSDDLEEEDREMAMDAAYAAYGDE